MMNWICPTCGTANDETIGTCPGCTTTQPTNPTVLIPAALPVDPAVANSPIPSGAGFGIRFLARFLDVLLSVLLGLAVGFMTGIVFAILAHLGKLTPEWPALVGRSSITGMALGILGAFLYHSITEGVGSVTVGKLCCGLRVVQLDGRPSGLRAAFLRSLAYHVDALFFGLVGYSSMSKNRLQQRYGDVWAKTVVVKRNEFAPIEPRSGLRITLGIFAGLLVWSGILALGLVLKVT